MRISSTSMPCSLRVLMRCSVCLIAAELYAPQSPRSPVMLTRPTFFTGRSSRSGMSRPSVFTRCSRPPRMRSRVSEKGRDRSTASCARRHRGRRQHHLRGRGAPRRPCRRTGLEVRGVRGARPVLLLRVRVSRREAHSGAKQRHLSSAHRRLRGAHRLGLRSVFEGLVWHVLHGVGFVLGVGGRGGVGGGREGVCGGRALQAGRESVEVGGGNRSERKLGKHWHSGTKRIKNRSVLSQNGYGGREGVCGG